MVNEEESADGEIVIDLYFDDMRTVFQDTLQIAGLTGVSPESIVYNYELLAMYLIRDSQDTSPRLSFLFLSW